MDRLTQKLGPLPVWVWGLLIGGLLVAWQWARAGRTSVVEAGTGDGSVDTGTNPLYPESSNVGASGNTDDSPNTSTDTTTSTNAYWYAQGVAYLVNQGNSPIAAGAALTRYLNGDGLTAAEGKMVDAVIRKLGVPPEGAYGASTVAPSVAAPSKPGVSNETSLRFTRAVTTPNSSVATFTVAYTNKAGHSNSIIDSGTVSVTRNGITVKDTVRGGLALVRIPDKMLPAKGATGTFNAKYTPSSKSVGSAITQFAITGK